MMVLAGGGLLMHSFIKLSTVDPGYDAANVLTFQVALPVGRYPLPALKTFADDMVARMQTAPGVVAAAHGQLPLVGLTETAWFRRTPELSRTPGGPEIRLVSRDYLEVMGIAVVAGRGFKDSGRAGQRVLLINQVLARREFPGANPIGQQVFAGPDAAPWEIVGVVARRSPVEPRSRPRTAGVRAGESVARYHGVSVGTVLLGPHAIGSDVARAARA